jgi:hypothetical protein
MKRRFDGRFPIYEQCEPVHASRTRFGSGCKVWIADHPALLAQFVAAMHEAALK